MTKRTKRLPPVPSGALAERWIRILRSPQTQTFYPDDAAALQLLAEWLEVYRGAVDVDYGAERERQLEREQRERAEREERERVEREQREEHERAEAERRLAETFAAEEQRAAEERAERERREREEREQHERTE